MLLTAGGVARECWPACLIFYCRLFGGTGESNLSGSIIITRNPKEYTANSQRLPLLPYFYDHNLLISTRHPLLCAIFHRLVLSLFMSAQAQNQPPLPLSYQLTVYFDQDWENTTHSEDRGGVRIAWHEAGAHRRHCTRLLLSSWKKSSLRASWCEGKARQSVCYVPGTRTASCIQRHLGCNRLTTANMKQARNQNFLIAW
jgi:hypothetical protein